jgi:hypothetical protein
LFFFWHLWSEWFEQLFFSLFFSLHLLPISRLSMHQFFSLSFPSNRFGRGLITAALKHSPSKRRITLKGRPPSTSGSSDLMSKVAVFQQQQDPRSSNFGHNVISDDKRDRSRDLRDTNTTTGQSSRTSLRSKNPLRSPPSTVVYITSVWWWSFNLDSS